MLSADLPHPCGSCEWQQQGLGSDCLDVLVSKIKLCQALIQSHTPISGSGNRNKTSLLTFAGCSSPLTSTQSLWDYGPTSSFLFGEGKSIKKNHENSLYIYT